MNIKIDKFLNDNWYSRTILKLIEHDTSNSTPVPTSYKIAATYIADVALCSTESLFQEGFCFNIKLTSEIVKDFFNLSGQSSASKIYNISVVKKFKQLLLILTMINCEVISFCFFCFFVILLWDIFYISLVFCFQTEFELPPLDYFN